MSEAKADILIFDRRLVEERNYWIEKLSVSRGPSNIRLDYPRPDAYGGQTAIFNASLSGEVYQKLKKLTGDGAFLLYAAQMAALKVCLHKYTGEPIIVVASPPRKPESAAANQMNALPLVDRIGGHLTFRQLLLNVRETLLEAYARQQYLFASLVNDLGLAGIENRCPIFDIALVLEEIHGRLPQLKNDITITLNREPDRLQWRVAFDEGLFRVETIERFVNHCFSILAAALENTNASISELQILGEAERRFILEECNNTGRDYHDTSSLQHLFEAQVEQRQQATALIFEDENLTYAELNRRANRLAHHLRSLGAGPNAHVGICLERSTDLIAALLGVLKSGASYVYLDIENRKEHPEFLLDEISLPIIVTRAEFAGYFSQDQTTVVCLDIDRDAIAEKSAENLEVNVLPENLAYVTFTSGSTGTPKGIMISHQALANRVMALIEAYRIDSGSRLLQFVSPVFDAFGEEVFTVLLGGGVLVMHHKPTALTSLELLDYCEQKQVNTLHIPPSYWAQLAVECAAHQRPLPKLVKLIITGGETSPIESLAVLAELGQSGLRFVNAYGPAEAIITSTTFEVEMNAERIREMQSLPIGRPLANTRIYLLDLYLQPAPIGVPGELYIGGEGLARGYLNRAELTAEKFVPDPFGASPGARLYRTGDLARYLPDGNIEFIRRADLQVKVRGYRIELEEIAAALKQHSAVREVVVIVREDTPGDKRLVAYLVLEQAGANSLAQPPGIGPLRSFLRERLPEYMLPQAFVFMDGLPRTTIGKIDREALAAPDAARPQLSTEYVAPRSGTEQKLAEIWAGLLKIEKVGVHDNFFDLGGHSLLAFQLVSRLRDVFKVDMPLNCLFEAPTLDALATALAQRLIQQGDAIKMEQMLAEVEQLPADEISKALDG